MASLTLKNVPDPLLKRLRKRAVQHRRSLNQEAIHTLEAAVQAPAASDDTITEEEIAAQLAAWRKLAGRWKSSKTAEQEIAEIYKARTRGRDVKL